jgi:hypothetical protein
MALTWVIQGWPAFWNDRVSRVIPKETGGQGITFKPRLARRECRFRHRKRETYLDYSRISDLGMGNANGVSVSILSEGEAPVS